MRTEIDDKIDGLADVKTYAIEALVNVKRAFRSTYCLKGDDLYPTVKDQLAELEERLVRVAYMCFEELSRLYESRKEADDVRAD